MEHPGVECVGGPRKRACGDLRHTQPMCSEAAIPLCSFLSLMQNGFCMIDQPQVDPKGAVPGKGRSQIGGSGYIS
jgi:hypothetical protein